MRAKEIATLPNAITAVRLIGAVLMLFTEAFGLPFYVIYSICGLTDVLDGHVARATGRTSAFGAKLDSVADLAFDAVMLTKGFRFLYKRLPHFIWHIVGLILFIRVICYTLAGIKFKRFASLHTKLNKATGAALFGIPYAFLIPVSIVPTVYCFLVCAIGLAAGGQELALHIRAKEYRPA